MENTSAETDVWLREHVSRFDHVTIRNSTVKDVDRWGIAVGYTAYLNYIDANYGDGSIDDASSRSTVPPTCASRTTTSRAPAATPSP